jgi:DNA repair exonuclease SbcCD ATPase subunit
VAPWFKTDRWVPRADLAQRRLNGARAALRAVEEREAQAQARIHELSGDDVGAVKMCEEDLDRRRREIEQLEARRAEARADLDRRVEARAKHVAVVRRRDAAKAAAAAERTAAEATLQNARHVLARAVSDLAAARERAARLAGLEASATRLDEVQGALGDLREQAAATQRKATEAEETRRRLLDRYKELERSRTGVCPVLKEACDRVSREAAGLDVLKAEGLTARREGERLTGLAREIAVKVDATLRDLVAVRDAARERQALRDLPSVEEATRVATVAEVAERDAVARLERVRVGDTDAQRALSREQADVDAAVVDLGTEAETRLAEVVNQLDDARRGCKQLETALLDARARLADVQRAREELRDVDALKAELRDRITKLAWAAYAFGAAGIPSRELENAFGVAEDAMNRVLADLRTSLRVRFSPTRELQDWEPACLGCGEPFAKGERTHVCQVCGAARRRRRRDELRLEVEDGGNQSAFELDSGGGQVLLSLGVRLGLASLPGASRRVRCQHVLIDEPDGALDEPNRAAVHGLIRRLGDLGIRQTILVTHADVRREFSSVVTVHRWEDEDRSAVFVE